MVTKGFSRSLRLSLVTLGGLLVGVASAAGPGLDLSEPLVTPGEAARATVSGEPGQPFVVAASGPGRGTGVRLAGDPVAAAAGGGRTSDLTVSGNLLLGPTTPTTGNVLKDGRLFLHAPAEGNTFLGDEAGNPAVSGSFNTAVGAGALRSVGGGGSNVAIGDDALASQTSGVDNVAVGSRALASDVAGAQNIAVGTRALAQLDDPVSSGFNIAVGAIALNSLRAGTGNVAVGNAAGFDLTSGSNNVYLGQRSTAPGTLPAVESNTIRIGNVETEATFIAGIADTNGSGATVVIDTDGRLGIPASSARFKDGVEDVGAAVEEVRRLRPVTFRFRPGHGDGGKARHYGLIAEEVADVYPELVRLDREGRPHGVRYEALPVLLLAEIQRLRQAVDAQARALDAQARALDAQREALDTLRAGLARPPGSPERNP